MSMSILKGLRGVCSDPPYLIELTKSSGRSIAPTRGCSMKMVSVFKHSKHSSRSERYGGALRRSWMSSSVGFVEVLVLLPGQITGPWGAFSFVLTGGSCSLTEVL